MLSFKKLDVYKCAIELLALWAGALESMRKSKGNAMLADQLKRAALSVPLNIAGGAGAGPRRGPGPRFPSTATATLTSHDHDSAPMRSWRR